MLFQLIKIQIIIKNVVSIINKREIPSIPNKMLKLNNVIKGSLNINWNFTKALLKLHNKYKNPKKDKLHKFNAISLIILVCLNFINDIKIIPIIGNNVFINKILFKCINFQKHIL